MKKRQTVLILGSSSKELIQIKDSRIPGVQDSSVMLKNYKELNVWQKSYKVCLHIYKDTKRFPKGDVERILKAMIKSLENKHLNP